MRAVDDIGNMEVRARMFSCCNMHSAMTRAGDVKLSWLACRHGHPRLDVKSVPGARTVMHLVSSASEDQHWIDQLTIPAYDEATD